MVVERSGDTRRAEPPERLAALAWLDGPASCLATLSARQRGPLAELMRGKPLGHPLHPLLTDLPIGFWTSSLLLDAIGGRRLAAASRALVGVGVISAVPTIVAGIADLPTLTAGKRRVAVVHAATNAAATMMYLKSWWVRRHHRIVGAAIGLAAATTATVGGYLGGWLAFGEEKPRDLSTARSQVA
jgi:uncharacterized membrane protein